MGYEIFSREHVRKLGTPQVTVSHLGRVTLNRAATEVFKKEAVESVLLLWDASAYRFAIRSTTNKKETRAFRVRYANKGNAASFSAISFFNHIGYDYETTSSYAANWNESEAMYEVQLPAERFGTQKPTLMDGGKKLTKTASAGH